MTAVPANTVGGQVKDSIMKPAHAEALAAAIFDGKRELKIGSHTVIAPAFDAMTKHERLILKGLFLKAKVKL